MHASRILRCCLDSVLGPMHKARSGRLLAAVEALVAGRRLTLTDLARSWPGAVWMHAPLKALDRLLSNRRMVDALLPLHQAMAVWLLRGPHPIILVDWADLKRDGRWALLRAAVPIGGRSLTLYEQVFPIKRMGQPKAQQEFLLRLQKVVPVGLVPILVTDAGFRSDWFRAVRGLGWEFIGRLRNNTKVRSMRQRLWRACSTLHGAASTQAADLGRHLIVEGNPFECRLVLAQRPKKGREQLTRCGQPQQGRSARKARKSAREPWLLVTSLTKDCRSPHQIVTAYGQRMQIEEAFRDLKSHRYGSGFEDSLSRKEHRLAVLLMVQTLATFAAWLMGLNARSESQLDPLTRQAKHQCRYSLIRRGMEWLRRTVLPPGIQTSLGRENPDEVWSRAMAQR